MVGSHASRRRWCGGPCRRQRAQPRCGWPNSPCLLALSERRPLVPCPRLLGPLLQPHAAMGAPSPRCNVHGSWPLTRSANVRFMFFFSQGSHRARGRNLGPERFEG